MVRVPASAFAHGAAGPSNHDGSGTNIADALAHGHRGEQLLELYAKDVRETATAVFGEVTLPALTL
ncbi:hypothetical protein [Streptomyces sp. WAC 06725]|uniref:hypothetical protein n=1 Tax=Streptomyces sp. WAC 06725 TaxID=2203209 RepID=UPI000F7360B6|nr:hypothetical protein [Streptomyces sp. WAC 06725]